MKKKALIVITKGDSIGGASVHVLDLVQYCNTIGILPVVACGGRGRFTALLEDIGVELHIIEDLSNSLNPLRDIRALLALISIISSVKPSLVSLHSGKAGILGRCACALIRFPFVVMTVHGWSYTGWAHSPVRLIYLALEAVSAILFHKTSYIMVSSFDLKSAPPLLRRLSNATVIHNGVTIPNPSSVAAAAEAPSPLRLITVCRLDEQKDVPSLLRAVALVPSVQLTIVGGGDQIGYCRELVGRLGISGNVTFVGSVSPDDVSHFYRHSDCFVLCSKWEGFPRTTIEAMAHALPVIVSDVGGACEIFNYGKDVGVSWGKTNNPYRIAAVIRQYSSDLALASAHGRNAREIACQYFSSGLMCRLTIDFWLKKNPLLLSGNLLVK
jgi:glycosyltransferase involved in cell wall biosynthesis